MNGLINSISINLENAYELSKKLEDDTYFELTKDEVVKYLETVNSGISKWKDYIKNNKINLIIDDYKNFESIISELELCLLDYDESFKIRDISNSYYELGKELVKFQKGGI